MKNKIALILGILAFIMLFEHCAKITGTLSGGPKDVKPPVFLNSTPSNHSTNFQGKRIDIVFDEYLKFKDMNSQFITSPPMNKKPETLLHNKIVRITLKEPLLENMTYSFSFGDAITDNNEGNVVNNFQYVFSTGDKIDSLTFTGTVLNAFDLRHRKKDDKTHTYVMLYDEIVDSVVYKKKPTYVAKVDNYGFFTFNYTRPDTFLVFAVRDAGDNLRFDVAGEHVAFLDTLLTLDHRYYYPDSIHLHTSFNTIDSIKEVTPGVVHSDVVMMLFQEKPTKQYRTGYERKESNKLRFTYNLPLDSVPQIALIDTVPSQPWYQVEMSMKRDTIDYWITDTVFVNKGTLMVSIASPFTDSLNRVVTKTDTLKMLYEHPEQPSGRGRNKDKVKKKLAPVEIMEITPSVKSGGAMDLLSRFQLTASQPIERIDPSKFIFYEQDDTIKKPVKYSLVKDTINSRRYFIDWKLVENTNYSLVIDTLAFTSVYGVNNDSIGLTFSSQKMDYYSTIEVKFDTLSMPVIIQAIKGDKEDIVKQVTLTKKKNAILDYLPPGKYNLKIIYDKNGNGKWDTGNYLEKIQPELVEYYPDEITTRSGWINEVNWELTKSYARPKIVKEEPKKK